MEFLVLYFVKYTLSFNKIHGTSDCDNTALHSISRDKLAPIHSTINRNDDECGVRKGAASGAVSPILSKVHYKTVFNTLID